MTERRSQNLFQYALDGVAAMVCPGCGANTKRMLACLDCWKKLPERALPMYAMFAFKKDYQQARDSIYGFFRLNRGCSEPHAFSQYLNADGDWFTDDEMFGNRSDNVIVDLRKNVFDPASRTENDEKRYGVWYPGSSWLHGSTPGWVPSKVGGDQYELTKDQADRLCEQMSRLYDAIPYEVREFRHILSADYVPTQMPTPEECAVNRRKAVINGLARDHFAVVMKSEIDKLSENRSSNRQHVIDVMFGVGDKKSTYPTEKAAALVHATAMMAARDDRCPF